MKNQIPISKLHLYTSTLGKYDLIDKYKNMFFSSINLKNFKFYNLFCKPIKTSLSTIVLKEFLTHKKVYAKKLNNQNFYHFIISIRKKYLFMYTEALMNFVFSLTIKNYSFTKTFSIIDIKISTLTSSHPFFTHLSLDSELSKITWKLILTPTSGVCINTIKNYLFFPSWSKGE